jgi:hypothetical protein
MREHTRYCPEYADLFKAEPMRALEPGVEYARWADEQRADDRAEHREGAIAEADRRRAVQAERWKTPDDLLGGPDA